MFYELRQYRSKPGRRAELAQYMEETIIPFQVARGMVITGAFTGEKEEDLYVWIRRFESEAEREKLYAAVYQDPEWVSTIGPKVGEYLDRDKIVVTRLEPMPKSVLR